MLRQHFRHGVVAQSADSNGGALVDVGGQMSLRQVVVEGREVWMLFQDTCDVVSARLVGGKQRSTQRRRATLPRRRKQEERGRFAVQETGV